MEEKFIRCYCGYSEHQIILTFDPDDDKDEPLFLEVHLRNWRNLFRRLWPAIKYLFGYHCRDGHWDCVGINPQKAQEMIAFLDRFCQSRMIEE